MGIKQYLGLFVAFTMVLNGCTKIEDTQRKEENKSSTHIEQGKNSSKTNGLQKNNTITKKLTINNSCIGCRKCVMIDPKHFQMSGHKSIPISQNNLDSPTVKEAINECPVGAISIN